jgi:hypothetical protein
VSFHARLVQDCPPLLPQTAAYPKSKRPSAAVVKANGLFWLSEEAFPEDFAGYIEHHARRRVQRRCQEAVLERRAGVSWEGDEMRPNIPGQLVPRGVPKDFH